MNSPELLPTRQADAPLIPLSSYTPPVSLLSYTNLHRMLFLIFSISFISEKTEILIYNDFISTIYLILSVILLFLLRLMPAFSLRERGQLPARSLSCPLHHISYRFGHCRLLSQKPFGLENQDEKHQHTENHVFEPDRLKRQMQSRFQLPLVSGEQNPHNNKQKDASNNTICASEAVKNDN